MKGKTFGQWLGLFIKLSLIGLIAIAVSVPLFTLANYSDAVEQTVSDIRIGDPIKTNADLVRLHYFYELSKKWHVQSLADRYLFKDAQFYEIADSYLIRDWEKVQTDLKDKLDDPRAYPYGNANFRKAQALYQTGKTKEALDIVMSEIASDFEKALRNCLDSTDEYNSCYGRVWNYDLATNKKDAEEALKNPGVKPKYMLGPIEQKEAPPLVPQDKKKKDGDREGEGEGGQGGPRKRP